MHPCRKLILSDRDQKILNFIAENEGCTLAMIKEMVPKMNEGQLKKRLQQLKKHKYIRFHRNFLNFQISFQEK